MTLYGTDGREIVPPQRVCYTGVLTEREAQAKIGPKYRVLELRPAQGLADHDSDRLVPCTEVIFGFARRRGGIP